MSQPPDLLEMKGKQFMLHLSAELADEARRIVHRDKEAVARGFASAPANIEMAELLIAASEVCAEVNAISGPASKEARRIFNAGRSGIATFRHSRQPQDDAA